MTIYFFNILLEGCKHVIKILQHKHWIASSIDICRNISNFAFTPLISTPPTVLIYLERPSNSLYMKTSHNFIIKDRHRSTQGTIVSIQNNRLGTLCASIRRTYATSLLYHVSFIILRFKFCVELILKWLNVKKRCLFSLKSKFFH